MNPRRETFVQSGDRVATGCGPAGWWPSGGTGFLLDYEGLAKPPHWARPGPTDFPTRNGTEFVDVSVLVRTISRV